MILTLLFMKWCELGAPISVEIKKKWQITILPPVWLPLHHKSSVIWLLCNQIFFNWSFAVTIPNLRAAWLEQTRNFLGQLKKFLNMSSNCKWDSDFLKSHISTTVGYPKPKGFVLKQLHLSIPYQRKMHISSSCNTLQKAKELTKTNKNIYWACICILCLHVLHWLRGETFRCISRVNHLQSFLKILPPSQHPASCRVVVRAHIAEKHLIRAAAFQYQ